MKKLKDKSGRGFCCTSLKSKYALSDQRSKECCKCFENVNDERQMKKLCARVLVDAACQTDAVEEEVRSPNAVRTRDLGCQANVPPERVCLSNISSSVPDTKAAKSKKNDVEKC